MSSATTDSRERPGVARPPRVAIVEDEETVREGVTFALRRQGYDVVAFDDGQTASDALEREWPDVVVLDITLPRMDGLEICKRLRARSATLPIIFLTSRDDEIDRVLGLELGADDYMCKPFSMRELLARIKGLLRRAAFSHLAGADARSETGHARGPAGEASEARDSSGTIEVGGLRLDTDCYFAWWRGTPVPMTVTEFLMLCALARHPGHVKSRAQLMSDAYGDRTFVSDRTIDSHIKRLRRKLSAVDAGCDPIETVYGMGYRCRPEQGE
jgi:DNA-binding response OmpR family regulator